MRWVLRGGIHPNESSHSMMRNTSQLAIIHWSMVFGCESDMYTSEFLCQLHAGPWLNTEPPYLRPFLLLFSIHTASHQANLPTTSRVASPNADLNAFSLFSTIATTLTNLQPKSLITRDLSKCCLLQTLSPPLKQYHRH